MANTPSISGALCLCTASTQVLLALHDLLFTQIREKAVHARHLCLHADSVAWAVPQNSRTSSERYFDNPGEKLQ